MNDDPEFDYTAVLEKALETLRADRKVYRAIIAALVVASALLGLALFITRENLIDCTTVVRHLETLL